MVSWFVYKVLCYGVDIEMSGASQSASGSLVVISAIADTPEGAYPLSALLMELKKLAGMMPDLLLSHKTITYLYTNA